MLFFERLFLLKYTGTVKQNLEFKRIFKIRHSFNAPPLHKWFVKIYFLVPRGWVMARSLKSYWLILIAFASTWWKCANQPISAFQASCWLCGRVARHIIHLFYGAAWWTHSVLPPGLKVPNLFFEEQSVFIRTHAFVDQAILQRVTLKKKNLRIRVSEEVSSHPWKHSSSYFPIKHIY